MRFLYGLLFGILVFGFSNASALEVGGYFENDALALLQRDGGTVLGDLNRLRLKVDHKFGNLSLHLEPRYYLLIRSQNLPLTGVSDVDRLVWDRLYLKLYSSLGNLTLGKQRIAWGSGSVWNPVDIFNPFVLSFAVREEDRSNVEAVRVEIPVGEAGGVDGFVLTDRPWSVTPQGIRAKWNVGRFDLAMSFVDQGNLGHQIGFDTAGDVVKDMGMRGEIVFKAAPAGDYTQAVLGGDYTLNNGVGLNIEYFYNGQGSREKNNYNWGTAESVGVDYLYCSANKIINEITTVTVSLLTNLDDQSFMIYPQFTRSLSQNVDLSLEALITGGELGSEFNPTDQQVSDGFAGSKVLLARVLYSF